jgi:hypothetical protein
MATRFAYNPVGCQRPQRRLDAAYNWRSLSGPGLVCGVSTMVLAAAGTAVDTPAGVRAIRGKVHVSG